MNRICRVASHLEWFAVVGRATIVAALVLVGAGPIAADDDPLSSPQASCEATAASEPPSEAWSPYPSDPWVPYRSELWAPGMDSSGGPVGPCPQLFVNELEAVADSTPWPRMAMTTGASQTFFSAPPLERVVIDGDAYDPAPRHVGSPSCDASRVESHFMPSLCRYGLVAPHTPGVESSHSPYLLGPTPWGAPTCEPALFAPPPTVAQQLADGQQTGGSQDHGYAAVPSRPQPPALNGYDSLHTHEPCIDPRAELAPYSTEDFTSDPFYDQMPYDACAEQGVYGDKYLNPTQRPLIEWGMPFYDNGPVPPPSLDCGPTNPSLPRFYLYGDYRAAVAHSDQNGIDKGVLANRLNLEWDLWLTSTERFHMFTGPFQDGNNFMRFEFDDGDTEFFDELDLFDANTDTLFFEGDLGYMIGGWTGRYASFDLPVAVGLIPLLFQNGYWMEDAIVGAAVTIPARNSPTFDWSNYDITFFAGFDQVTSPAFGASNSAAHVLGATTFIEAKGGYFEVGYAFLDDTADQDRSYHNVGISYTRRYLNLMSNSLRAIGNAGQSGPVDQRTANGVLLVAENSFLTPWPYNVIPYANLFAGLDAPQSVARAGAAGAILRNVGILFESDFLTGYPTLDATANETYGGAIGVDLLAPGFTHQLILEAATVQAYGNPQFRNAPGDQYGIGARYQVPISNATLLRFDAMHGWLEDADNISGVRAEYRWKF